MSRQYGCGQGVRETQHGHDLSKQLMILAVDRSQRLDATKYLRYTMSLSCVFNIIVVLIVLLSKNSAAVFGQYVLQILKYTNIVARVHLKQPRRAFFGGVCGLFEYNILYDAYVQQKLQGILFPVYILQWQETCLRENGTLPEPNLCQCKLNV